MATEDEAREAADGTEVQVEAVDLGTVHLEAHTEGKLSSIMDIKNVGEIINSTEGTLKIPEDKVLVEAPSEVQLPPEHNLNGEASSLNGHMEVEEKISNEQMQESVEQEAELDGTTAYQNNGINKEEVTDGLNTTEDSTVLKCEKDEEPKGDDLQDLGVTVDNESVQEGTLKTDSDVEQTDDGQQDQNQEPEKEDNANVQVLAEASIGLQTPAEPHLDDSEAIPETIDEKTKTDEPTTSDSVGHPDHEESFPEGTPIAEPTEEAVKVLNRQSQQAETMDADVVQQEMIKCEETDVQEEVPKSETHELTIDAQEALNQESAEQTDDPINEKIHETVQQSQVAATEKKDDGQQDQDLEPEKATEDTQPESIANIPDAEVVAEASSGVQTPVEPNLENSDAVPDIIDGNAETDESGKADSVVHSEATNDTYPASISNIPDAEVVAEAPSGVQTPMEPNLENSDAIPDIVDGNTETDEPTTSDSVSHPDHEESFTEDTPIAEPTEEAVKVLDRQSQQAETMNVDVVQQEMIKCEETDVQEEVPKSETHELTIDAQEALNQESAEQTDDPINEKIHETVQQSKVAATEKKDDGQQDQDLESEKATEDTQPESIANIPDAEVVAEASSGVQTPVEPNLENSDAVPDTVDGNTETDEPGKADSVVHSEATNDTYPASISNIPDAEVVAEAPSGVQTPMEPNLENSDAIPSIVDGNTETDEPTTSDSVSHPDHEESFTEDTPIAEPTEEAVKVLDRQSQLAETMNVDVVQQEMIKCEETDVQEEVPKSETHELKIDAQEALNQESAEQTDDPVNEKIDETVQQSKVAATEKKDDGQQDQALEPEKATDDTQPASIANIPDDEVVAEAPSGVQTPVEHNLENSDAVPNIVDGNTETDEPGKADSVVHSDHKESFPEDTSTAEPTEEEVKVQGQQSKQAGVMDADVVQEEVPKSEHADESATDAHEVLNQKTVEETDGTVNEKTEETMCQSNLATPEETMPEHNATREAPVNIQVQNQESLEERGGAEAVDTEEPMQQSSSVCEEAVPEDQHSLGSATDDATVQENTLEAIEQTEDGQQYQDLEPEQATENKQPASMASIPDVEVVDEAPGFEAPVEINLNNSVSIPDTSDGNTETDEPAKADGVAEPTEEMVQVEDQHSQQVDVIDSDVLQEEVLQSEHAHELATDAQEVINQESAEETDRLVNEKTEETEHKSNMATLEETMPEHDAQTRESPENIQVQSQGSSEEIEDVTESETQQTSVAFEETTPEDHVATSGGAEVVDTEEPMQQSSAVCEEAVPEDQHSLGSTTDAATVQENILEAIEQAEDGQQYEDLEPEKATENTRPASPASIPDVEVVGEAPGFEAPVEINLNNSVSIPETSDGNTETDEPAKAYGVAEPTEEVVQVKDQHSQQVDVIDPDVFQEEVLKSEHADELATDAQEVINQESAEETDCLVNEKTEETEHKSNMATLEETMPEHDAQTREPPANIQVQNQESSEEIEDVTESETQQTSVAFEETSPEDHVATTEPHSEIQHVHHVESEEINGPGDVKQEEEITNKSNTENAVQDNILQSGATADIHPVQELSIEDDSTVDEPHNDDIQQTLEQDLIEMKDTETYHEKNISTSEDTVEAIVTVEEPTSDSQEVDNAESTEGTKANIAENIAEVSDVVIVDEAVQQNVPQTEDIAETHTRELEPEETKSIEPVESEEASDQRNAALFGDSAQEDNALESEMQQMESATEIKETEAVPQESNVPGSEEHSPEDHIIVSDGDKDIITGAISGQSNIVSPGDSAQETNVPESEPPADIQAVQEPGLEETKNREPEEVKETSHEMNATAFQTPTQEDNSGTAELHESTEASNIEATEEQGTPHQSDVAAPSVEQATEEMATEPEILESESVEEINDTEANETQSIFQKDIISTSEESVPEAIATEDNITTEPDVDQQGLRDQETAEVKEIEADKPEAIASSGALEESTSDDIVTATEPSSDNQADNSQSAEVNEDTENVKSNTALDEEAAPETEATADTSPVLEAELEETKDIEQIVTEDIMTSGDLPSEKMDMETMETEAVSHDSNVASIKELTQDDDLTLNAPHADTEQVLELESVEDTKCTDTTEKPGEPHCSSSDEMTPTEKKITVTEPAFNTQELQSQTPQEIKDSEDGKTDEFSDIRSFPTPEGVDQESNLPRIEPTPDIQEVRELGSTEGTRDIEAVEHEDHQEHRVFTLEESAVDSEPSADDQQVHEDKLPEVKDNEAIEAEEATEQSIIATPDNTAEERSELESDPESYVQSAVQVELSKDNENIQIVKAEETSGQSNSDALEETTTEDSVASEVEPPVDTKQDNKQERGEEIKGVDATEGEEDFHKSQADTIEELVSENNTATTEPTYGIQQADDLEATKSEIAASEEPTPTDNGATPEETVESNQEMMENETDCVILAREIKDEIQESAELKDDVSDLSETVLTQRSENMTDEDAVQSSSNDTLETSSNIHQVKEEQKAGTEHSSSQMSSEQNRENITHVQDRDVEEEILRERGTAEASQALFENDPGEAEDVTEKADTIKGDEQTSYDSRQHGYVALQQQSCETDALSMEKQDEALQKIELGQKQKEDEEIEYQNEEQKPQVDEPTQEEKRADLTTEPLMEHQNIENGATNRTADNDAVEAEQTEATITEITKNEEALHITEESTPRIMDVKVESTKGTGEGTEEDDDVKDEQENDDNDDIIAKFSSDNQLKTTDEITNEELESGLESSVQEASDPAPSNDKILENEPEAVTQNIESGERGEDKECTNKVNDDVHTIKGSEKEIADKIEENKEKQNEDDAIHHDELQTEPEKEEAPQLCSNEPYNMDTKIHDTAPLHEAKNHDNASIKPRDIEEIGENKGPDSTSEPFAESSIQNNVEQDLNSHHKVEDEKLSMTDQNAVDIEAMQEKVDESASDINQSQKCQEEINTDDVLNLATQENSFDKIEETVSHEKTETSNTTVTEAVTINEDITDKASRADVAPSDKSLNTFNDTGRDLDVSSAISGSKEQSMNENMEDRNLDLPENPGQDATPEQALCLEETEREMPLSEKLLQIEPVENKTTNEEDIHKENQIPKENNEEDMQDTEIGNAQKEVEQDLPVSSFLMNLILGKENSDADGNLESEAEKEQGETTEDNSYVLVSKQEESVESFATKNKVDDSLTFEQEKHEVKCSEETLEMVKEQSDDLKLDTERLMEADEEFNKNTRGLEITAYQDNPQDEISGELMSEEAAGFSTKNESRDIEISSIELDDRAVDAVCQQNMEVSTKSENGSLRSNLIDSTYTKASEVDSLGEGHTGLLLDPLPEDKSGNGVSEQAPLLTQPGTTDVNDFSSSTQSVQNPVCTKQDKPTESSNMEATSSPDIQPENEVDKNEENKHENTATDEGSEENVESSHFNLQKSSSSEVTSDAQATQIAESVSDTQMNLACEKEISERSAWVDEKENLQTAVEIHADGPNMPINQDKQDEAAGSETVMEPEKLVESNFQELQKTGVEQKSPKESDEGDRQFLSKKEILTKEQDVYVTVETPKETASIKSNENEELFASNVQERDFNVVSPREASEAENFVDVTKPQFSTDEEQSPKPDAEEKSYDEKIKGIEGTKNFADEAAMKTAAQKARKKLNLLSGVGSKVKHQLAKVKKAIVGKPGHTKPESPKS
ncbi:hypothetical protein U9M48_025784 [Paspalum notatum var. saurae]|uniref:Uncharacterized protein n=1 Tax=Paspalum notatum var. saurae TaxID=547442 RepID=A0AAQ3TR58_PASNO